MARALTTLGLRLLGIAHLRGQLLLRNDLVTRLPHRIGTSIVIGGVTYTIRGREPLDDGAEVLLQLEAA